MIRPTPPLALICLVLTACGHSPPAVTACRYLGRNVEGFHEYSLKKDPSLTLILVPGADVWLGWPRKDPPFTTLPRKRHTLLPFLISKYEVSAEQFQLFVSEVGLDWERGRSQPDWPRVPPPWGNAVDLPAVNLSWEDATAYCRWAGLKLPTELQWEYAARGHDERVHPWGDAPLRPERCRGGLADDSGPVPVRSLAPGAGPFGAIHQVGNVGEWCQETVDETELERLGMKPASEGRWGVYRGGAAEFILTDCTTTTRQFFRVWGQSGNVGFRPILPLLPDS